MKFKLADAICASMVALYLGTLLIVASGYQAGIRQLLASEITAAWIGALGTISAVLAGFWLARAQAQVQAEHALAAERRAIAARLRAATMIVHSTYSTLTRVLTNARLHASPRKVVGQAIERDVPAMAKAALYQIDVALLPVPAAIDCVIAARGWLQFITEEMQRFAEGDGDTTKAMSDLESSGEDLLSCFVELAQLTERFDPEWRVPDLAG